MFGSKLGGFGTSASTFGSTTPFGGGQNTAGFGAAFGAQTPSAGGGLFGSSTAQPAGGLFGQQATNSFGGQQQQTTGFSFGTPSNTSAASGLFGQQTAGAGGGLFSTPQTASAFGTKPQAFGGAGGGLFGGATQQPSTGTSLFGTAGGGLFGGASAAPAGGTTVKFNPPSGQDTMSKSGVTTSINTRHQCITAMKEYENKSLEELRVEDYLANRKGKAQGTATAFFGQTPAATQAASTGFSFGQPAATAATGTGFTGFGASTSTATGGGLFGASKPLFGGTSTATTTQQSGFSFGGTPAATQAGSLFGQSKPLFGTTTTQSGGLFGTSQPAGFGASTGFGGFGQATGGLLGSKPIGFGTTTTASTGFGAGGSLFNKPATTSAFSFGAGTTGFGAGASTGGGLFGAAKPAGFGAGTTGLGLGAGGLGAGATAGGLFGSQPAKPGFSFGQTGTTGTAFSLGGAPTGGLFGGNAATLGTNTTTVSSTAADLHQQLLAISPYGDSPLFWNLKNQNSNKREEVLKPTNPVAQKALLDSGSYKVSVRPLAKIKPKSLHGMMSTSKSQLFEGLEEEEDYGFGGEIFVPRRSVKRLVLKKGAGGSGISRDSSVVDSPADGPQQLSPRDIPPITRPVDAQQGQGDEFDQGATTPIIQTVEFTPTSISAGDTPRREREAVNSRAQHLYPRLDDSYVPQQAGGRDRSQEENGDGERGQDDMYQAADQEDGNISDNLSNNLSNNLSVDPLPVDSPPHPAGVVLTRPGYYTIPSMEELGRMVDSEGNCFVEELTIGREGYGSVFFYGTVNVAGLDLDSIVHFRRKEISLYPDESKKPPVGEGLNRRAEVTLDFVWPFDKNTREVIKCPQRLRHMKFQDKLEATSRMINAKFIDYRPESGSWVFEVPHFSKYGLASDDDEDIEPTEEEKRKLKEQEEAKRAVQKQKIAIMKATKRDHKGVAQQGLVEGVGSAASSPLLVEKEDYDDAMDMLPDITRERFPSDYMDTMDDDLTHQDSLPLRLGVSARNVQLMKASFFSEDMADPHKGEGKILKSGEKSMPSLFNTSTIMKQSMTPRAMSPDPNEFMKEKNKSLFEAKFGHTNFGRPPPTFLHPPPTEYKLLPSGLSQEDLLPPKMVGLRVRHEVPGYRDSLVYGKQRLLVDSGCFMGRSFRAGWGLGWTLGHAGAPCAASEEDGADGVSVKQPRYSVLASVGGGEGQSRRKAWTVTMEQLSVASFFDPTDSLIKKSHEDLLEIALEHCRLGVDGGCPVAAPVPSTAALHNYALTNAAKSCPVHHKDRPMQNQMQLVWELCVALWGEPDTMDDDTELGGYAECEARREAFSQWLSAASLAKIQAEVAASAHQAEGHLVGILSYLSGGQVSEACRLAQNCGDDRLALLLAQARGSDITRQMVARQLTKWAEMGATEFISEQRQRVYCVLGGQLLWDGPQTVNTCTGLDWKRALAFHLWYQCQPNAPIADALRRYEAAFQGRGEEGPAYAAPPLPPYLEESSGLDDMGMEEEEDGGEGGKVLDVCYHLLKLFSQKGYQLEAILNPTCATPNSLDHRLSWHLHCVLQALDFHHLSPYHCASLHANYAAQLESLGLWHWAILPLMHITDNAQREAAIKGVLGRHVQLSEEEEYLEQEQFVLERLNLPPQWIHSAKATKAGYLGEHKMHASHLLKAERWNEAHQVIVTHLAAEAIVNEEYRDLMAYLEKLAVPERCLSILNWNNCGKVYHDFIQLSRRLKEVQQSQDALSGSEHEELVGEVRSLSGRVRHLPCTCPMDLHCQSLMASHSVAMLRSLLPSSVKPSGWQPTACATDLLSQTLYGLPIPEDCALQELRELTGSHLLEFIH